MVIHPIAQTSDAGSAEREEEQGPKTYYSGDFSDTEDSVGWWRAVAVIGILLVVEGLILVSNLSTVRLPGPGGAIVPYLPATIFAMVVVIGIGGVVAAALGFGPEALAFFGAAVVGLGFYAYVASSSISTAGQTLGGDLIALGILLAIGALLLAVGATKLVRVYRALSMEA
jgi:hypothetical protein